jgi:hypothetical protein
MAIGVTLAAVFRDLRDIFVTDAIVIQSNPPWIRSAQASVLALPRTGAVSNVAVEFHSLGHVYKPATIASRVYFSELRSCSSRLAISRGSGAYPNAEHCFWPEVSTH